MSPCGGWEWAGLPFPTGCFVCAGCCQRVLDETIVSFDVCHGLVFAGKQIYASAVMGQDGLMGETQRPQVHPCAP